MIANDYAMTDEQLDALMGTTSISVDMRRIILRKFLADHGGDALADLFAEFIGLANSVVENSREAAELLLITEGGLDPRQAEKINLPTILGALYGVALAAGIDASKTCNGCAFRQGSWANQSLSTTVDAADCSEVGGQTFMCHEEMDEGGNPVKACAGFAQARAKAKREFV